MSYNPNPELLPADVIERAKKLNAALLSDGMKALGIKGCGSMDAAMMPVNPSLTMVGTAVTVKTDNGDNFPIHVATYQGGPGYVMVVDGNKNTERAYFGDLIMGAAKAIGYEGIVMDGYTRDTTGCIAMGFPVYSIGIKQAGPIKKDPGELNVPIVCAGIAVNPGDLVVGDADGVTVVPRERVYEVLEEAEKKSAYEDNRDATIAEYNRCKAEGLETPQLAPQWVLDMLAEMKK
ncbi:MAG: RraA family protein [Lachnospiraceae bacterium]|nr:RraA family protein [Lachnospiraceae bacterium]